MRLKLPLRIVTLVCAVSLLAYACGDSTSPVEGKPVSLTLLPSEFTLNAVGDTKDLGPSFPGGERAIQKALVDNDFRGLESIEDVVGVPIETLLAEWAATLVFTNFARDVDVRAASTAYFVLAGNVQSPTAVRVRDQADGQLPPNMQVFLVRIC
ncbi:MAG: hypothetical protein IID06_05220 [Gemmatimonadetes bacterium]|nr:hypothetical protein [Gemmatimonadota bacterium]